jgi:hypothetical protein
MKSQSIKKSSLCLHYISDKTGKKTGVYIPIEDWRILKKHLLNVVKIKYSTSAKADILEDNKEVFNEIKLQSKGKTKLKPEKDHLDIISYNKVRVNANRKELLFEEIKEAVDYIKLVKRGKVKTKPLNELLNEL